MNVILSTEEILLLTVLDKEIDEKWIDWALEMLSNGIETDNMYILAGEKVPMNQFEAKKLIEKIFDELKIDYTNKDKIIKNFVGYLIQKVNKNEIDKFEMLNKIYLLYLELDRINYLQDFYLLYLAKCDFNIHNQEISFYWNIEDTNRGVLKKDIDNEILKYFEMWRRKYCE